MVRSVVAIGLRINGSEILMPAVFSQAPHHHIMMRYVCRKVRENPLGAKMQLCGELRNAIALFS
jgi:hypothetical protein